MAPFLAVRGLTVRFGGITALDDVSFDVAENSITGLIGPNGAGKTTCFNCITRFYQPASGAIEFEGEDLLHDAPHSIARRRISRTFQNVALFNRMTVLDNVLVGSHARFENGSGEREARREAARILDYLDLSAVAHQPVRNLSFGTRKSIELARALAASPKLLLLDEPAGGLNAEEVTKLGETICRIRGDFGTTVLMVEHHMRLVMGISECVVVLDSGRTIASGSPEAIQGNTAVIEAYLGTV